jgi:hypothetical protein
VVKHFDIQQATSFYHGACQCDIIRTGSRIAAGMVVGQDDGGGVTAYGALNNSPTRTLEEFSEPR